MTGSRTSPRNWILPSIAGVVALATLVTCGDWSPVAETRHQLEALSSDESGLRVRGLPDSAVDALARFEKLHMLDFSGGWAATPCRITDLGLARLAALQLPELEVLHLGGCPGITDQGLASISTLKNLTFLEVGSPSVTDAGVRSLATLAGLEILYLEFPELTDTGLAAIAADLRKLWLLRLRSCERVSSFACLRDLPELRMLHLADFAVDERGLEDLATLDQLQQLDLSRTGVSSEAMEELSRRLPGCTVTDYAVPAR